jgi:hypothetical protein
MVPIKNRAGLGLHPIASLTCGSFQIHHKQNYMAFIHKLKALLSKNNNQRKETSKTRNKTVALQVKELETALVEHELINKT